MVAAVSCNIAIGGGLCGSVAAWRIEIDLYLESALLLPLLPNGGERLRGLRVEAALRRGAVLRSGLSRRPQPALDAAQPRGLGVAAHRQEEGRRCRDQEKPHFESAYLKVGSCQP